MVNQTLVQPQAQARPLSANGQNGTGSPGVEAAPDRGYVVHRPEQLEALSSPARREIVDTVQLIGPCSIVEVAEVLGKPADSLYYHVRKLARVGLLVQVAIRRGQRREEAVYDVPGRPMRLRLDPKDPLAASILSSSAAATLRLAERNFRSAVEEGRGCVEGRLRDLMCLRVRRPLSDRELEEVNAHIDAIVNILNKPVDDASLSGEAVHAVTIAVMPIETRPVQRRSG